MEGIEYLGKCVIIRERNEEHWLIVGDLHLGYEEALEKSGVMIGRKMFEEVIGEFERIFERLKNEEKKIGKVIVLGDIKHEFCKLSNQEWGDLIRLLDYFERKLGEEGELIIIKGNHDNYLLKLGKRRKIEVKDYLIIGKYCFLHGDKEFDEIYDEKIKYWIMGHLHPAVKIRDKERVRTEKYKCFLEGKSEGKKIIILPSFAGHSEGSDPREGRVEMPWKFNLLEFRVRVVGTNLEVLDFGKLEKL